MQRWRRFRTEMSLARRVGVSRKALKAAAASKVFDEHFYLQTYPEVAEATVSPFEHYLATGRLEKRKPSAIFDPSAYTAANPAVVTSGMEPFLHYVLVGRAAGAPLSTAETIAPRPALTREIASGTKRLIVFLTPGYDGRFGGVLSIAAIYRETEGLNGLHRAKVALCGVPGDDPLFLKYTWFENSNYLLDLTALLRACADLEYLLVHIPEYAVNLMAAWLDGVSSSLLRTIREIHLNVMVQNIDLVEGQKVAELRRFGKVTATTLHEAYSNSATRQMLGVSVHKLGTLFGPELYQRSTYRDKQPLLVVSHDAHPLKEHVLKQ